MRGWPSDTGDTCLTPPPGWQKEEWVVVNLADSLPPPDSPSQEPLHDKNVPLRHWVMRKELPCKCHSLRSPRVEGGMVPRKCLVDEQLGLLLTAKVLSLINLVTTCKCDSNGKSFLCCSLQFPPPPPPTEEEQKRRKRKGGKFPNWVL